MKHSILVPILMLVFAIVGSVCHGDVITVGKAGGVDYSTIQAAINAYQDHDLVLVKEGTYTGSGNCDLNITKSLRLYGVHGPEGCVIDCEHAARGMSVISTTQGGHRAGIAPYVHMEGFTIT
ncbi:MAG: hypothetical protein KAS23_07600, partial [Anaerohalosphaera sp.]|nr:hypothetical protein [Anaerohalosphaera sp.]